MLTFQRAHELLHYDCATGEFTWKVATACCIQVGSRAGSLNADGYRFIQIDGRKYGANRLALFMSHGYWPARQVDHRDGNKSNDQLLNLREASQAQNQHNRPARVCNRLGLKGVTLTRTRRYEARITAFGRGHHLGTFDTPEQAHAAYAKAADELHGSFARAK